MSRRLSRVLPAVFFLVFCCRLAAAAPMSHESIVIDGDLTDLITAVNNNLGSSNGGYTEPNPLGNIYSPSCSFVNGFDIRNVWMLFDFKDANGNFSPDNVVFYAGWEVEGMIGDVDGDGNPSTYTAISNFTCANNGDQTGIGMFEAYNAFIDLDCDLNPDVAIAVQNNMVFLQTNPGVPLAGAEFAYNGHYLELKIPNLQSYLPPGGDLCQADVFLTANSQFDGLGEDFSMAFPLRVDPSMQLTKTPVTQDACVGQDISWTIKVKNDGLCTLDQVAVDDTLDMGMTFVSSNPPSTGDLQVRHWTLLNLAAGDSAEITLTANVGSCNPGGPHVNRVTAEGVHEVMCVEPTTVTVRKSAMATVTCRETPCDLTGDNHTCVGNTETYTTTVGAPFLRLWTVTSTPPGICSIVGGNTGPSVDVNFTGAGACTVHLTVSDPLDPDACQTTCDYPVTVDPLPPCDIAGPESVCAPDTLTYTTTVGAMYTRSWSATSTPPGICNILGSTTGGSVEVRFTGAGQCTISLSVADPNDPEDCPNSCTWLVNVNEQATCDISGDAHTCVGNTETYTTTVGAPFIRTWSVTSVPAGICAINGPTDGASVEVQFTGVGTCTVHLAVTNPQDQACGAECEYPVTVDPLPPCDIAGPESACAPDTLTYTTTVGAMYDRSWSATSTPPGICNILGSTTGGSVEVRFTGAGQCTISLNVADPNDPEDCPNSCMWLVNVNSQASCDIAGDQHVCVGGTETYTTTVTAPFIRTWSVTSVPAGICAINGPTDGASVEVQFTGTGTCTVHLAVTNPQDPQACGAECDYPVTVVQQTPCQIEGPLQACAPETLTYSTTVMAPYTKTWSVSSTPAGLASIVGGNTGSSVEVSFTGAGQCTVHLAVIDPADPEECPADCMQLVQVFTAPPCDISGPATACVEETHAYATTVDGGLTKAWSVTSTPPGICNITGPTDGASIQVMFTGAGQCTVMLAVTDPNAPEGCDASCMQLVTVEDCSAFACPHTIGFWRQQCAQKGNGSTKVCLTGMQNLWRCVITDTGVLQWKKNDGSYETTAYLAGLTDANLFTALCSQLQGPRPMTIRDMTEVQYLGLMLNVCSGALPLNIPISNGYNGTVAGAIAGIENALNTGDNLGYWESIADQINNRIGVNAADCPEGDDLFRHLPGCEGADAGSDLLIGGAPVPDVLETRAYPNPLAGGTATIYFTVPEKQGGGMVDLTVFDVTGRVVKKLVSEPRSAGSWTAEWDLTDGSGAPVHAGIFFYRLTVGSEKVTQKIMVLNR